MSKTKSGYKTSTYYNLPIRNNGVLQSMELMLVGTEAPHGTSATISTAIITMTGYDREIRIQKRQQIRHIIVKAFRFGN